ncbi:hypothetical protein KNW46_004822, partial [Salmonella enterica]|nr:hypothetical protein [Salmonella enterica]
TTGSGQGMSIANGTLTASHDINLSAQAAGGQGIVISNGSMTASSGTLTLNGSASAASGAGLSVTGTLLNATHASFTGSNSGGTGFSLTNLTLSSSLSDLVNVTFSSAGSGASAVNYLDNSVVTDANRDTLLNRTMDNLTNIDMNGTAIFNNASAGWTHDYSSTDKPNGGWIFNNTNVTAGGDVNLTGVGFNNATITVTNGSFSLSGNGPAVLTDNTLSATGAVNLSSGSGVTLTGTTVSAGSDITLLGGGSDSAIIQVTNSSLTSNGGNITLDQLNHSTTGADGEASANPGALTIKVSNSTLNASNTSSAGNITLSAYNPNVNLSLPQYTGTIRNGGSVLEVSGNSALHGNNIVLQSQLDGNLSTGLPVFLNGSTLTADNDLTIRGVVTNGAQ